VVIRIREDAGFVRIKGRVSTFIDIMRQAFICHLII
jgi:hypothetical protein